MAVDCFPYLAHSAALLFFPDLAAGTRARSRMQGLSTTHDILSTLPSFEESLLRGTAVASSADFGALPEA